MNKYFDNKELFSSPVVSQYGNHMVMTNVRKETKRKYINIDTKFCDEYVNNRTNSTNKSYNIASYNITFPEKITNVKSMVVCNIEVPMTFFNISSSLGNNYFNITTNIGSGPIIGKDPISGENINYSAMIVIPDGEYSYSSLSTTLNNLLAANNVEGYYISHRIENSRSIFTMEGGGNNFNVNFAVTRDGQFDKYNIKSKLGWLLGYRDINYRVDASSPGESPSESVINLNIQRYLYLVVDEFSNGNQNSFLTVLPKYQINKNIIAKVVLNKYIYPFGSVLPANNFDGYLMTDKRTYIGTVDIQKINVQLIDENGNPINLNGADFSFCVEIEYE